MTDNIRQFCYIYEDNGSRALRVVRKGVETNTVTDLKGRYIKEKEKVMTDKELMRLKGIHNLCFEEELGDQLTIDNLLDDM